MRFWIISILVHHFYIFGGLLWGVLASAFFSIFRRQPTMVNCKNLSVTLFSIKSYPKNDYFLSFAYNLFSIEKVQRGRGKQTSSSDIKILKSCHFEAWTSHIVLLKNEFIAYFPGRNSVKHLRNENYFRENFIFDILLGFEYLNRSLIYDYSSISVNIHLPNVYFTDQSVDC